MEVHKYYQAALGQKNADFYLSRFHHFDSNGVRPSWNWPAFLFTFYWLLYRKMRFFALVYVLLPIPLAAIDSIVFPAGDVAVTSQLITTRGGTGNLALTIVVSLLLMIMLAVAAALLEQVLGAGV